MGWLTEAPYVCASESLFKASYLLFRAHSQKAYEPSSHLDSKRSKKKAIANTSVHENTPVLLSGNTTGRNEENLSQN